MTWVERTGVGGGIHATALQGERKPHAMERVSEGRIDALERVTVNEC